MPRFVNNIFRLKLLHFRAKPSSIINTVRRFASASTAAKAQDDKHLWVPSIHPDLKLIEGVTFPEFLRAQAGNWGNSIAYECSETGLKYTHNEVYSMSRSFAAALIKSKKFQYGDVIGVVLRNIPEYCSIMFGIWDAGLIASPVNPQYSNDEICRQLGSCGAKAAITSSDYLQAVIKSTNSAECQSLKAIIVVGEAHEGCHSFYEMAKSDTWGVEFFKGSQFDTKEQTCLLPYSSGTTGNPKGVELTHFNMITNILQVTAPGMTNIKRFDNGNTQERFLALLPLFHIYGLAVFIGTALLKGAHVMCLPKFLPETFLKAVREHKPTSLHLVTPLINHIVNSKDFGREELSEVSTVIGGAAPIGPTLIKKLVEKAGRHFDFQEGYGMTELSPVSHFLTPDAGHKIGSCGGPVANTVTKIVDVSTGETLGRNERGEVIVKGPQVMKGYFNNEKATRECLDEDGWLRTGDIGYYDSEGFLYIVDRLKELIKVKGFQVAPSELEDLLREHPDVSDVAIIGVPNEDSGELPRAYIVRENKSLSESDVNSYLKDKIASYKQLRGGVEFVETIPKNPSGKILRRELLLEYKRNNGLQI